ncbi:MAG: hypothetical protein IJZ42_03195 [Lachnospiraceae bacterium]|nr:hypothetical protein [Lachnospiraceae bacterium]
MKGFDYVYILPNSSFRENWVKTGKSSRPVDVEAKNWICATSRTEYFGNLSRDEVLFL